MAWRGCRAGSEGGAGSWQHQPGFWNTPLASCLPLAHTHTAGPLPCRGVTVFLFNYSNSTLPPGSHPPDCHRGRECSRSPAMVGYNCSPAQPKWLLNESREDCGWCCELICGKPVLQLSLSGSESWRTRVDELTRCMVSKFLPVVQRVEQYGIFETGTRRINC